MRTLRVALVLLALAVFIGATMAAAGATTAAPAAISAPAMKPTIKPTIKPTTMSAPKMLSGMDKFSQVNKAAGNVVKQEVQMMTRNTQNEIARNSGKTSAKLATPGMRAMPAGLGKMPSLSAMKMPALISLGSI